MGRGWCRIREDFKRGAIGRVAIDRGDIGHWLLASYPEVITSENQTFPSYQGFMLNVGILKPLILWNRLRRVKDFGASKILARQIWRVKNLARQKFGASKIWRVKNMVRKARQKFWRQKFWRVKYFGASNILARQKFGASKIWRIRRVKNMARKACKACKARHLVHSLKTGVLKLYVIHQISFFSISFFGFGLKQLSTGNKVQL